MRILALARVAFGDQPIVGLRMKDLVAGAGPFVDRGHYENAACIRMIIGEKFRYANVIEEAKSDTTPTLRVVLRSGQRGRMAETTDPTKFAEIIKSILIYES